MRERGIIFNAEMVRAVLSGSKTQTRRIIVPSMRTADAQFELHQQPDGSWRPMHTFNEGSFDSKGCERPINCPFGAVGDRLWVRETWSSDFANYYPNDRVWYAADDDRRLDIEIVDGVRGIYSPESNVHVPFRWRPSIHMPRWASRITLEITGVRVERLQDISNADASAEGMKDIKPWTGLDGCIGSGGASAREKFEVLWESIYGEESWQVNPWVWVIEFKRVEGV